MSYILNEASFKYYSMRFAFYSSPITITEMELVIPECVINPTIEELQKSYEFVSFFLFRITNFYLKVLPCISKKSYVKN